MGAWRRFWSLNAGDRLLVTRTAALLVLTRIGLWVLPFATLRGLLDRYARWPAAGKRRIRAPGSEREPATIAWAAAAVSRRIPAMTCLVQALAADALLRRAGYPSDLRIGVRGRQGDATSPPPSHAWVECEGVVVVGGAADLAEYAVLAAPDRS